MWKLTLQVTNHLIEQLEDERRRGRLVFMTRTCYLMAFHLMAVIIYAVVVKTDLHQLSHQRLGEIAAQGGLALFCFYGAVRLWLAHRQQRQSSLIFDLFGTGLLGVGYALLVILPDLLFRGPTTQTFLGRFLFFYSWLLSGIIGTVVLVYGMITFVSRYEIERSERRRLQALIRFTEHLANPDEPAMLTEAVQQLQALLNADSGVLYLWDSAEELLVPVASTFRNIYDPGYIAQMRSFKVPRGFGATGWVFETGRPQIITNALTDQHAQSLPGWDCGERSGIVVPIGDGGPLGVVRMTRHGANQFSQEDADLASSFARQVSLVLRHTRAMQELSALSITDHLTGLYNVRHLFTILERELDRAQRYDQSLAVVMVDSDALKQVNDRHGHQQGDNHLRLIGATLTSSLRSSDWAFRYAGDEFVLVLPMTTAEQASEIGERLRERISTTGRLPGIEPTISVGVAAFPLHGKTVHELLRAADLALYASKRNGKNRLTVAPHVQAAFTQMDEEPDDSASAI